MTEISTFVPEHGTQMRPFGRHSLSQAQARLLCWFLGVLLLVRLAGVFTLPFTDTTEARYAEIARKMVETGDWITPQFDYGVPFWGKPPLHTWLSALGMEVFGVNGFGARILILACTLAVLWLVFRWVRDEMDKAIALVSVAVLSSSVLFFGAAAFVMTDMAMTLGIVLVMTGVWRALNAQGSQAAGLMAFAGLAIGLLAKGPVAVVLCLIPLAGWGLASGRWREAGRLPWLQGSVVLTVLALPWYIGAELKTPGFLNYFLIGEHFERFTVPDWQGDLYGNGHERPKGAIWLDWVAAFLPWSLAFLPLLLKQRNVILGFAQDRSGWRLYLLFWAVSPMILFTPAANILAAYTLPGLPAAAVLLATLYADAWAGRLPPVMKGLFALCCAFTLALGLVFASLGQLAPQSVNLRSERELIAALNETDPAAPVYYLGARSYSAEFYTAGQAQTVAGLAELDALAAPHGLAVSASEDQAASAALPPGYQRLGQFGRRVLYYRGPAGEAGQ